MRCDVARLDPPRARASHTRIGRASRRGAGGGVVIRAIAVELPVTQDDRWPLRDDARRSWRRPASAVSHAESRSLDESFLRIDRAEALDDLETAASSLGDVHVHAHVVLAGHHLRRAAGAIGYLRMVERSDHV